MKNKLRIAKRLIKKSLKTKDPYLELGNCGITNLNDLPELFRCTHLETLILSNSWSNFDVFIYSNDYFLEDDIPFSDNKGDLNKLDFIPHKIRKLNN